MNLFTHTDIYTPNTNFASWANNFYGAYAWTPAEAFSSRFAKSLSIQPVFECPDDLVINTNSNYVPYEKVNRIRLLPIK